MSCPVCGDRCSCAHASGRGAIAAPYLTEAGTISALIDPDLNPTGMNYPSEETRGWGDSAASLTTSSKNIFTEPMPAADQEFEAHEPWREEVASRLNSYRRRQKRKVDPESSMRLDFDAQPSPVHAAIVQAVTERIPDPDVSCDVEYFRRTNQATAPVYDPEPEVTEPEPQIEDAAMFFEPEPAEPRYDPDFDFETPRNYVAAQPNPGTTDEHGNLIVFPTQPTYLAEPPVYELAEPVIERPRILEVPEEVMPTIQGPLFANIDLDPEEQEDPVRLGPVHFEVPLQVALIGQRLYGGVIDALFVLCGFGVLSAVAWKIMPDLPNGKMALIAPFATLAILWLAYQYMFITYAGETPGMHIANMSLVNFEGGRPDFERRRQRALSMIVSLISGGVGFGWALLDPDTLCWHDSISRTYVTQDN
jgi:uncharacterized RDD family membrane protein YckC